MPSVFSSRGYKFHFFSNEGDPREPYHIHVEKDEADAKLWLYPEITFAYNYGFDAKTQRWIVSVVSGRREEIRAAWDEHFGTGN